MSAGSICWFEGGTTDSFGPELRPLTNGSASCRTATASTTTPTPAAARWSTGSSPRARCRSATAPTTAWASSTAPNSSTPSARHRARGRTSSGARGTGRSRSAWNRACSRHRGTDVPDGRPGASLQLPSRPEVLNGVRAPTAPRVRHVHARRHHVGVAERARTDFGGGTAVQPRQRQQRLLRLVALRARVQPQGAVGEGGGERAEGPSGSASARTAGSGNTWVSVPLGRPAPSRTAAPAARPPPAPPVRARPARPADSGFSGGSKAGSVTSGASRDRRPAARRRRTDRRRGQQPAQALDGGGEVAQVGEVEPGVEPAA